MKAFDRKARAGIRKFAKKPAAKKRGDDQKIKTPPISPGGAFIK
jgi:hypothetical protein